MKSIHHYNLEKKYRKKSSRLKLSEGWMFLKVKISDIANSSLNVAETKFNKVGLAPP